MSSLHTLRFTSGHAPRWLDGVLIDVIGGGAMLALDGTTTSSSVFWACTFDRAAVIPDGAYEVIFVASGTKGVVSADRTRLVSEIDRSFY